MGQKYALTDENGCAKGFYDDAIHGAAIPHEAIPVTDDIWRAWTGDTIEQRWNGSALEPWIDPSGYSVETLAARIKAEAARRILEAMPEWKQRNMIARGLELSRIEIAGESLSPEEQAEEEAINAAWSFAKAVRQASDDLEAQISEMNEDARRNFTPTDDSHWPVSS